MFKKVENFTSKMKYIKKGLNGNAGNEKCNK